MTIITGTLHEDLYTRVIISHSVLLRMRNFSYKSCRKKAKHKCSLSITFFFENSKVYEIIWKNILEPGRLQMNEWLMRIARWIPKAINKHSGYAEHIALPLPRW